MANTEAFRRRSKGVILGYLNWQLEVIEKKISEATNQNVETRLQYQKECLLTLREMAEKG